MSSLRGCFASMILLTLVGTVSLADDIRTDYDHHVNFSQYHTYCWERLKTTDPFWRSRVQDSVDQELQSKGWQRIKTGCDVAVTAVGATKDQREYNTFYDGMGGWRWGGFGERTTTVETYPVGALVVDLYDTRRRELIWRGIAHDSLSNNADKNTKKLEKSITKMFDHFPPQAKD